MNIAVSPIALKQYRANKAVRARLRANALKPNLLGPSEPKASQNDELEKKVVMAAYKDPDWVKVWKQREAEALANAAIIPLKNPTVESIQNYCLKQKWADSEVIVLPKEFTIVDLKSNKRNRSIVLVRHAAIYIAHKLTEQSAVSIGKMFGGRDHTSVLHALNKIKERLDHGNFLMNGKPFNLDRIGEI